MSAITNFIMKPHYPTQLTLYTCPVVNIFVRFFQSSHYFDALRKRTSTETINEFKQHQAIYRKAISTSYKTQAVLFIATFVLAIMFPPGSMAYSVLAFANTTFFLGIPSLWATDKFFYKSSSFLASGFEMLKA
jgi:hypothetical protein